MNKELTYTEINYKKIFGLFFLFRLLNLLITKSWFVPDEYWQSQEVAHHLAFK